MVGGEAAEDLGELPLHLLLLATDKGDDVVEDVERGDARIPCARNGLHRRDHDGLEGTKGGFEGVERDGKARGGAIGVGNDEAF